jgi:alcohol dehydrogenase class IV
VAVGWPTIDETYVAAVDPPTRSISNASQLINDAAAVHAVTGRPTPSDAAEINRLLDETGARLVVSIGAGLVIDAAKLAVFERHRQTGTLVAHDAVPCGPEPYRAITPFSMYDARPGAREGVQEEWLRPRSAAVVPQLLDQLNDATVALFAGDSAVHAVESLLSRLTNSESQQQATTAAQIFIEEASAPTLNPTRLAEASIAAAAAFDTTKLGLAHALSRPLGIATGESHDAYNLMLGPPVVRFWGDSVIKSTPLQSCFQSIGDCEDLLDGYRRRAGLPDSLSQMPLTPADIDAAIKWAPKSSGIPNLPAPLRAGDLERVMADAWA